MRVRWACSRCGAHGLTRIESRQVWHVCNPPKRGRRRVRLPEIEHITREEARGAVWSGLKEAMDARDADWMLRPLDDETEVA